MAVLIICAIILFIITLLALFAAVGRLPRGKNAAASISGAAYDKAVFREQTAELDKMRRHGLLDKDSAAAAELELARRILSAEKQLREEADGEPPRGRAFRAFLTLAVLFIPVFSALVYYYQGRPYLPSAPFSSFMARDPAAMNETEKIVRLEALNAREPKNGRYADELAALYLQAGRFQDAANAYNHALALSGENAERLLGYALALTGFEDGIVGQDAEKAFRKVLRLDPQNSQAQLFLARGLLQSGQTEAAIALLESFQRRTPPNSPWAKDLASAITALKTGTPPPAADAQAGAVGAEQGAAGAEKASAAQNQELSAAQRRFIAANLPKLEAKLKAEPQNRQGREMLINAYLLLGEQAKANAALAEGLRLLPPAEAKQLAAFAARKGLAAPAATAENSAAVAEKPAAAKPIESAPPLGAEPDAAAPRVKPMNEGQSPE